jgi:hypothetical protein
MNTNLDNINLDNFKGDDINLETATSQDNLQSVVKFNPPPPDKFTLEEAQKAVYLYQKYYNLNTAQAMNSITYWLQSGGYIKTVPDRTYNINGIGEESLGLLREIIKKVRKNGTLRQFARAIPMYLINVARANHYPGHLSKALRLIDPSLQDQDLYFACEYYMDYQETPRKIIEALAERTKARAKSRTPKPGPKRKRKR